jgi:hypothetical protein
VSEENRQRAINLRAAEQREEMDGTIQALAQAVRHEFSVSCSLCGCSGLFAAVFRWDAARQFYLDGWRMKNGQPICNSCLAAMKEGRKR